MRIGLFVGTALPKVGGAEIVVDRLARHWQALGHEPVVLAPRPSAFSFPDDSALPYRVCRHPPFLSSRYGVEFYRRYLLAEHRRAPLDIVHCHGIYPHGYLAALVKSEIAAPLVFTSHGGDVGPDDRRYAKPQVAKKLRWAMTQLDVMIAIAPFTANGFRRQCPDVPIVEIPNGVDSEPFAEPIVRPHGLDDSIEPHAYFLFLGRLAHRKGVDVLIEALAMMPDREPPGIELVIAGSGNELPELQMLAVARGVEERIRFVGAVAGQRKNYLLQNALCTVLPSRRWEAFPLVLLESFAAGTPVIGSDADGLGDLIRASKAGYTVPPESPRELAKALVAVSADRDNAARLRAAALHYAARHSWKIIARRHLDLFESLRANRTAERRIAA